MSHPEVLPGAVISHYRVEARLGAGGMGEVYVATDETLGRKVALKAVRRERLDRDAKARFRREARILSQLDHPNICRVYDYVETESRDWLVLELIDGRTLREVIAAGMTPAERLRVAMTIADVLSAMHAANVIHRDLKPTNVMLGAGGDAKVLDFGLSATIDEPDAASAGPPVVPLDDEARSGVSVFHSMPGSIVGTFAYMSPEQMRGEGATTASDMYAFGVLLREMYTARAPDGSPPYAKDVPVPPPVPRAMADLIARLCAAVPSQRPTAVDAVEALRLIADAPRRRRRHLAVAAAVIVAMLGAAKYTWDLARERTAAIAARDEADRRREQAESLIGFMVGDLRTRLTAVGRLEILDEVGRRAMEYFEAVPAGTLTGEELFRRSQTLHQLGQVRQARGDLDGALKAYQESLEEAEAVVRSDPDNATWQIGLGASHFYVGDIKRRRRDLDGALVHFRAYQEIAKQLVERDPDNVEFTLELSYGYSNIAAILSDQGQLEEALAHLETTRDLQIEVARAKPGDVAIQTSRANNFNRISVVLRRLGRFDDAVASLERELEIYETIGKQDPGNARHQRRIVVSHGFLGQTLRAMGRHDESLAQYLKARDGSRALAATDPANADWQRDAGIYELHLGRVLLIDGQTARSLDGFRRAVVTLGLLLKRDPGSDRAQRDLASAHMDVADALAAEGQLAEALRETESAVRGLTALWHKNANDVATLRDLARLHYLRGHLWASTGRHDQARRAWESAAELLVPIVSGATEYEVIDPYVRALIRLGRIEEAERERARLLAMGYRDRGFTSFWNRYVPDAERP